MTAADIIVASVQANPPGGDIAVSPAVRVLVEEIVGLRAQLKHLGELSEADHNRLRERGDKAVAALTSVCNLIENDPDNLNSESMVDTIWIGPAEPWSITSMLFWRDLAMSDDPTAPAIERLADLYRRNDGVMRRCNYYEYARCIRKCCHRDGCDHANKILKTMPGAGDAE